MKVIYINKIMKIMSYQKVHTYILLWFYVANDDEKELTSFKIVEQIEFIQKYFYQKLSWMTQQ